MWLDPLQQSLTCPTVHHDTQQPDFMPGFFISTNRLATCKQQPNVAPVAVSTLLLCSAEGKSTNNSTLNIAN